MADQHADTRLYLVVHQSLRVTLDRFVRAAERLEPSALAGVVESRWALFARLLHVHHEHEDDDFFPIIAAASPDLQPLIEQLEREHEELVALLDAVDGAVAALVATPDAETRRAVHDTIAAVRDQLVPHLDIEDEKLLPAAAATVDPKEWDEASDRALRSIPRADLPVAAGTLDEVARSLPPDRRPPPPPRFLRFMLTLSWRRRYAKFIEPLDA